MCASLPDPAPSATAHAQSAGSLRDERDRFVGFAFAAGDLLIEVSAKGRILFVAGAAKALTGSEAVDLIGKSFSLLVAEPDRQVAEMVLGQVREDGRADSVTLALAGSGGETVHVTMTGCQLPEKGSSIYLSIASARARATSAVLKGVRDAETGLLDSASFGEAAGEMLSHGKELGQSLELALLRLKGLDDLRARADGDALGRFLTEVGAFLRMHSVDGNTAGRLADGKFGLIRSRASAKVDLGDEIETMSRSYDPKGDGVQATEVGVDLDASGITADDAAKALAFTLGRFANAGSGEFPVTSLVEGFRAQISDTVKRISRLKAAAASDKMTVAFQPIVALDSNLLHHHEMLARFDQNKSPFEMIQFAEKIGMIEEIDLTMCQSAITTLLDLEGPPLDLAVNISGRSLNSDLFIEALTALLAPHARLSKQILFEITESTAMANLPRVDRILTSLRKSGYRICLDDFGAGASSFPYLQALSVDFVKVDGSYVSRMRDSAKDRAILKAMVVMCRDLGVGMIAEMIERVDQARDLLEMGIGYGQGYLFGRPAPSLTTFAPALGNVRAAEKTAKVALQGRGERGGGLVKRQRPAQRLR